MKKILLSLSMCLLAIAANAQTAGENPAINIEEEVFYFWEDGMESANSVKFADGATTTITGNSEKKVSSGNDITVGDKAYKSMKVSNGSENTFVAPAGKTPVQVTFYSYINKDLGATDRTTFWAEVDGQTFTAETGTVHKSFKDGANPDIVTFNLAGNSSFTYTNKGDQVCYVMKVAYGTISGGSTETQTPIITLTADVDGAARNFEFGSGVADNKISIDWGNGNIVEEATIAGVYDGWEVPVTVISGKPVGSGEIKIYATGAVTYFDCVSKVDGPGITKLDVSNAAELTELYANGNKLTTFDGSKLTKLSKVYLNNNQLTSLSLPESVTYINLQNNKLTSFDGSKLPLVTSLYISDNTGLGTLDVSMMPALKSLYALNCGLTSVNAPLKVAKAYISVNNNKLETLDVTEATGLENGSLFATGNNLTEVKLPNVKVKAVNISNNKFTLATIPATANVTTLTYAPQQEMEIADIDGTIDLSAQNNLTGFATEAKPTVYTWITEANDTLVAGTDYTEDAGKFTFVKEQAQKVYCTMTTEALPKFTGANIFKTIAVAVKAAAGGSTEPQTPIITLTADVDGAERTFEFGSGVADNKISIDWGNGTIVEGATAGVYDGWTTTKVTGKPVGSGEIKIYATGAVTYFDCVSKVDGPGITKLDVSNAAELTELYANGNKLTTFDGSKLTKLSKVYLNNNQLTSLSLPESVTYINLQNNKLTSFDGSKLPLVTSLYISDNTGLGTLDVSMMPALKSLYALNCGLTSVNAPLKVAKAYISVNNNKLETLDVTEATGLENGSLFAMGNNLTEVKLPNVKVKSVNISKNKFTLATIPATANVTTLTYAPQQDMEIADIDGTIDLSAQNNLTGFATEAKPTVYAWYAEDGTALVAGTDYTEDAGKFTFVKEQAQKVYCTMTTEALPKFTGTNIFKTIAVAVKATSTGIENIESDAAMTGDIYSVDGKLIKRGANLSDMQKGLYIIKTAAGKTVKVSK